jgi:DNA modification methylase
MPNYDLFGNEILEYADLKGKFLIPPFSIFDTRQGYWQERKKKWKNIIKDKGESRETSLGNSELTAGKYKTGCSNIAPNVSILDPVIAEICIKWFGMNSCNIIDPFAGDTVFGYVAGFLGNNFTGIEIREAQAQINNERTKEFKCKYICDDGQNILKHIDINTQDLLFSCPPYFDLEIYSNLPNDASNQKEYDDYLNIIDNAFSGAIKTLKNDRFAFIVIGDVRDKNGFYRLLPDDIKRIFVKNRMFLYNDIVLLEQSGTGAMRAPKQFGSLKKVIKTHQNILVFYKGNPKNIKLNYGSENME